MNRLAHLETKHWLLIAGFLAATANVMSGADHWSDLIKPQVVGGLVGQLAALIGAVFMGAPVNPNLTPQDNPARRAEDVPLGTVSDATRRNL